MIVEQLYTGCLAQGAYYIESDGEAAIIDPLREVQTYLDMAARREAKIKYIFETHFHADFVSGHVTLAEKTGAPIVYGPNADPSFDALIARDEQEFPLGKARIRVLHTPGHTMESTTYLLIDEQGKEYAIFSGDTLFLGDVGRPDLAQKGADMTQEDLASLLYDSLRQRIMTLPDEVIVYPGHGAGSACGKNMSKETVGTIGQQKQTNYALRENMTREEFIREVTDGLATPPAYFPLNVRLNREGYEDVDVVMDKARHAFTPDALEQAANETGAIVLDVRHQNDFAAGHIPRSVFIGLDGSFAPWVGAMIRDVQQPIILVAPEDRLEEAITRLARVGFDNILGYLQGGFAAWKAAGKETDTVAQVTAEEYARLSKAEKPAVFDVRKPGEYQSEHLSGAVNAPLDELNNYLKEFPETGDTYVHCAGGYRSMIAASVLKARGIHNLVDIQGGFGALKKTDAERSDYVCPSTL